MVLSQMNKRINGLNIEKNIDIYVAENENEMFNKIPLDRIILVTEENKPYLVFMGSKTYENYTYASRLKPSPITVC